MAQQTINVGTAPNDGTGTPLRTAFQYTNSNFSELYTAVGPSGNNIVVPGSATITGDLTVRTNKLQVTSTGVGFGMTPITPFSGVVGTTGAVFFRTTDPAAPVASPYIQAPASTGFSSISPVYGFWYQGCGIGNPALNNVSVITDSTERYKIDITGVATWSNVGGVAGTAMTLNSTGLGVGGSPATKLHVKGGLPVFRLDNSSTGLNQFDTGVDSLGAYFRTYVVDGIRWYNAAGGIPMTLDASGNLLLAKTAVSQTTLGFMAEAAGTVTSTLASSTTGSTFNVYSTGAAAYRFYVGMNGTISATNTTISAISDARLKENVQDIDVGLGAILALKPRKFDWKEGKGKNIKGDRGFIAQEFEQVFPNLIDEWKDPAPEGEAPYKSVRQDLIPVLVKAIQELAAEVNALKNA